MDARNLAIVFGPTLIRTKEESMVTMVKDMSDQCRIVESVLTHVSLSEKIFCCHCPAEANTVEQNKSRENSLFKVLRFGCCS